MIVSLQKTENIRQRAENKQLYVIGYLLLVRAYRRQTVANEASILVSIYWNQIIFAQDLCYSQIEYL